MTRAPRLGALDLLRGLTVAAMIVVNNPGNWAAVFGQLSHAPWQGLTLADCIFPAFIFIMGVPMGLSRQHAGPSRHLDTDTHRADTRRIVRRGMVLVTMGLALNLAAAWPAVADVRLPGVLQRIGLTYVATALLLRHARARTVLAWAVGLLVLHSLLLASGPLEPGVNLAARIDRAVFGTHLLTASGDPEGLLGLLTSVVTALCGVATGWLLRRDLAERGTPESRTVLSVGLLGVVGLLLGLGVAQLLPVNKALWTASFTLVTSGVAALSLAGCLLIARTRLADAAAPLLWLGINPLAIYFLSELTTTVLQRPLLTIGGQGTALKDLVYWELLVPVVGDGGGPSSSFLYAALYAGLWIGVAGVLRSRDLRFKV